MTPRRPRPSAAGETGLRAIARRTRPLRVLLAAALGVAAALLVSCGSSGKGLIPAADAGPLQTDFEAVSQAARTGNGDCTETEAALAKTEQDFNGLPGTIDGGLRTRLREGITNLGSRARALCAQPLGGTTTGTTATSTTTTPTTTTPTVTTPTTTATTPTAPTTPTTPGTGGGTPAPGESEHGSDEGEGGAGGVGAGGSEGGK